MAPFGHQVNVRLIVFISEEGSQPPVAPLRDMVGDAGSYDTSNTGHVRKLSHSFSRVKFELSMVSLEFPDQPQSREHAVQVHLPVDSSFSSGVSGWTLISFHLKHRMGNYRQNVKMQRWSKARFCFTRVVDFVRMKSC